MADYQDEIIKVEKFTNFLVGGRNAWHCQWQLVPVERLTRQDLARLGFRDNFGETSGMSLCSNYCILKNKEIFVEFKLGSELIFILYIFYICCALLGPYYKTHNIMIFRMSTDIYSLN